MACSWQVVLSEVFAAALSSRFALSMLVRSHPRRFGKLALPGSTFISDHYADGLNRGRVGIIYTINVALGYMVTEWIGLGLYFISENSNWRVLFGLQLLPTFMMLIGS